MTDTLKEALDRLAKVRRTYDWSRDKQDKNPFRTQAPRLPRRRKKSPAPAATPHWVDK